MACFSTHLSVAIATSGICAASLLVAGLANPLEIALYFSLGIIGGISPDLDADNSTPFRISFELFPVFGATLIILNLTNRFSLIELCLVWLGVFLILRYGLFYAFAKLTVHRGVFHTIPMALLFGCLTAIALHRLGGMSVLRAWIAGAFMIIGYVTHLILDEIYSINIYGARLKNSFGTAFKLFAPRSPIASLFLYIALFGAWKFAPDINPFLHTFNNNQLWQRIENRILPNKFFK